MIVLGNFYILPREMFKDENLSLMDINHYGAIISLSQTTGHCFATNNYLAEYFNVTTRMITRSISKLKLNNYICVNDKHQRKIYPIKYVDN